MRREPSVPRADWPSRCERVGFSFHSADGGYWDESVCYRFSADQIDVLEAATETLHGLCMAAVDHVIGERRLGELGIPDAFHRYVTASWERREPSLFGRFDLAWNGSGEPRLLEYNADTPTSLLEAAIVQWYWLRDVRPGSDQFNSLHEHLVARWQALRPRLGRALHFGCATDNEEDVANVAYLMETAIEAGFEVAQLDMADIGFAEQARRFVDRERRIITALFKLYPWEWLLREPFATHVPEAGLRFVEPPWKAILSNKAILCVLWELFPGHPNLLPAYRSPEPLGTVHVRKPIHSREGANVSIVSPALQVSTPGPYGADGYVYQAYAPLPSFEGWRPVLGTWIVGDEACGLGIREDRSPVTGNLSHFVPHYFE